MGNDSPKGQKKEQHHETKGFKACEELQEDIYILQRLQNISLKPANNNIHFWVDPKIFNSQNQKYETYLKKHLQLQSFSSVEGLENHVMQLEPNRKFKVICAASLNDQDYKKLQADNRISAMFLFCQNQERAKLLRSNFSKIKSAKFDIIELKDTILQMEENEDNSIPKNSMLFMIEDDTNMMNKYRINFYSLTCNHSTKSAKRDFVNLAKKLYPENSNQIDEFEKSYSLNLPQEEKIQQALNWIGRQNFFFQSTQSLPKITMDPKKLGYLRFPFKECYDAIMSNYKKKPKKVGELYMVIIPTSEELEKFKENVNNYIIFTTFTKAFTTEKGAQKFMKTNPNAILFQVMLPSMSGKVIESLDFGYWINSNVTEGPNVIFNIYNVFKILEFEESIKEGILEYGSLADVAFKRQKNRDSYRLSPWQQKLIRNYDYLEDVISNINSQATVLQMSGYYKQSIQVYDRKFQYIRKSQPSQQILDKHTIQMGDIYMMNEDYQKAQQQFLSVKGGKMHLIVLVHLAELYFKTHEDQKIKKIIEEIQRNLEKYKEISNPDAFKAQNYIGMELMNRGKYKQANKLYKMLINDAARHYDYKYEGIPLVHDIFRNRAACQTKLNNFQEALSLLDSTKSWQKVCQGSKSPGLLITQNLIRSIHASRGSVSQLKQSQAEIKRIKNSVSQSDNIYVSRSAAVVNLDESTFHIQTTHPPKQNLEESKIKIETTHAPKQNLEESKIKIETTHAPKQNLQESTFKIETSNPNTQQNADLKQSAINIDI